MIEPVRSAGEPFVIAVAGNPNCGKTTIFNRLTGQRYKVANYPGVTVEKKEAQVTLPDLGAVLMFDLPGTYTLSGSSYDEIIATKAVFGMLDSASQPDLIVVTVDASNLERNLYLVSQLIDCEIPLLIALNMCDLAEEKGIKIHKELLSRALDTPVVGLVARRGVGIEDLRSAMTSAGKAAKKSSKILGWCNLPAEMVAKISGLGQKYLQSEKVRSNCSPLMFGLNLLSESLSSRDPQITAAVAELGAELRAGGIDPVTFEATSRYAWIHELVKQSASENPPEGRWSYYERIDSFITHPVYGSLVLLLTMALIFQAIFLWATIPMDFIDGSMVALGRWVAEHMAEGTLRSLIVDGIIAGVGSVLVFIPQIAILFFFLGLLEDSGYLSRAAFLLDKIMRKVGLQGRSFIPLLSSFACAIPGIMSTRTIPSRSDKLTTIMVAPFMSCSARLPVYAVLIAAFIPRVFFAGFLSLQGLVLLALYLLGVAGAAAAAWVIKKTILRHEPAVFVMEMPPFRRPSLRIVLREVYDRVMSFVKNAGTMIFACAVVLWFLASYPKPAPEFTGNPVEVSFAGHIGKAIEPAIKPLGFNWEIGVGLLASFAAREVFISTLSTVYNISADDENNDSLIDLLEKKRDRGDFILPTALSLMVFFVYACQCMSTLAVCRRETGSWLWTTGMFAYMTVMAWISSFAVYRLALHYLG